MRMLHYFVVKLDKRLHDTVSLGDKEIYVDTKFNEFDHRVCHGEVISVPEKYDTPVNVGDRLFFHHLVVVDGGMPFGDREGEFLVSYDPDVMINCHAFAYTPQGSDEIIPLSMWSVLSACAAEIREESAVIESVSLKTENPDRGHLSYVTSDHEEMGLNLLDKVVFPSKYRYDFKNLEGGIMYRVRTSDSLYVEQEVHSD